MELRTREMVTSMGLYALLTMVVYQIALSQAGSLFNPADIAAGLLWLAFVFTSMLGLNRSLVHEKDQGCMEALLLSPVDRPVIYFAKVIGNLAFLLVVEVLTIPVFAFLFLQGRERGFNGPLWLIPLVVVAASIGIAGVGTLLATMSVNTTGKDVILAVMFIPLMYPLLLAAVSATNAALLGGQAFPVSLVWQGLGIIAGYDAIMLLAAFGLYEFIVGA
ncbi:MAG: heme ABC transporter permease CcmB [Coriobacteriaceae bacterium]|nr:heme ABC transporter permease CcmB [Coriobacteriaceae bacterium]